MRKLQTVKALDNFTLSCLFDGGVHKIADINPFLQSEAFMPLQDMEVFNKVINKEYYVSWLDEEVDLSADMLWHIGIESTHRSPIVALQG